MFLSPWQGNFERGEHHPVLSISKRVARAGFSQKSHMSVKGGDISSMHLGFGYTKQKLEKGLTTPGGLWKPLNLTDTGTRRFKSKDILAFSLAASRLTRPQSHPPSDDNSSIMAKVTRGWRLMVRLNHLPKWSVDQSNRPESGWRSWNATCSLPLPRNILEPLTNCL